MTTGTSETTERTRRRRRRVNGDGGAPADGEALSAPVVTTTVVEEPVTTQGAGLLEIVPDGHGFLRNARLSPSNDDVYVAQSQIRRFNLRTGDMIEGRVRPPKEVERYPSLLYVERINGLPAEMAQKRPLFEQLTPIHPNVQIVLSTEPNILPTRIVDVIAPIGRGQRG